VERLSTEVWDITVSLLATLPVLVCRPDSARLSSLAWRDLNLACFFFKP
jgi:hypothetical protein